MPAAQEAGGMTVGILPGSDRSAANRPVTVAVATGLDELRNGLVVRAADAVIAITGAYSTLAEIALAFEAPAGRGSRDVGDPGRGRRRRPRRGDRAGPGLMARLPRRPKT
jgi:hypothetical protein